MLSSSLASIPNKSKILDLGSGDGEFSNSLKSKKIISKKKLYCLDISPRLLKIAKETLGKNVVYRTGDVRKTPFFNNYFNLIYSWMVIEHVHNPEEMLKEIKRLLKPGGKAFISTIVKKPWALYFYRNSGKFVIDPTHLHEFSSLEEFENMITNRGMRVLDSKITQRWYSLPELFVKIFMRIGLISPSINTKKIFSNQKFNILRNMLKIPIPGFFEAQVLCQKI